MKIEVFHPSAPEIIETYSVPYLSLLDFQDQAGVNEGKIEIDLNNLSNTVNNLNLEESEPSKRSVDFYLPESSTDSLFYRLIYSQMENKESDSLSKDRLNEIREKVSRPVLRSRTIFSAVVTEILHNHHPHSEYKVRITDD